MIVKARTARGSFVMYDDVQGIEFTEPNKFYARPPEYCCPDSDTDSGKSGRRNLEEFIENLVANYEPISNDHRDEIKKKSHTISIDLTDDGILTHCGRKIIFIGSVGNVEQFCFKLTTFMRKQKEYWIFSEYPVYICDDNGKTIEVVK